MRRKSRITLNPVERAIARQRWSAAALNAHLQALMGGDYAKVVDAVATMTFVVGLAADIDKVPRTNTDLRIIEGAARTALDVVIASEITDLQRGSLGSGIMAVGRLVPTLSDHAMIVASQTLQHLLKTNGGVHWRDFEYVFGKREN